MEAILKQHLLLVEDDKNLGKLLQTHLEEEGFKTWLVDNGQEALHILTEMKESFNLIVLDIMLPGIDGMELANKIKEAQINTPFLFLSARNLRSDKLNGYELGAEDYVTKPFDPDELTYKIKAILRRIEPKKEIENEIEAGGFKLNLKLRLLECGDFKKKLSAKESELLGLLFQQLGEIVPRDKALVSIWGRSDYFTSKSMDVYITKIRKMLSQGNGLSLENIHGYGFRLVEETIAG